MRSGAPSSFSTRRTSAWASRSWMTRALPCRLAISMWARKDLLLRVLALGPGAEVVEARLTDALDLGQRGQPVDLGERVVQGGPAAGFARSLPRPAVGVAVDDPGRLVRVQGDRRVDGVVAAAVSAAQREPARSQPTCTTVRDRRRLRQRLLDRAGLHVQMGVGVGDRHPEGVRERGDGVLAGVVRRHAPILRKGYALPDGGGPGRASTRGAGRVSSPCAGRGATGRTAAGVVLGLLIGILRHGRLHGPGGRRHAVMPVLRVARRLDPPGPHDPYDVSVAVLARGLAGQGEGTTLPSAT
ncbi:hypothetical protein SALBM311S_06320 [Streptomyces alboniger]